MRVGAVVVSSILALAASAAADDEAFHPLGPPFGTNRYATTIDPVGGQPDVDDYVAPLARGDRLSVSVAADAKSPLVPTLFFLDPTGAEVDPTVTRKRHGRTLVAASFVVPTTGAWSVRVGGADGTSGGYVVRFKIVSPKPYRTAPRTLGGDTPSVATYAIPAVNGSSLSFNVRSSGDVVAARSLVDPSGRNVALPAGGVVAKNVPLAGGDGDYVLTVGVADGGANGGAATYSIFFDVKPPPRPRGSVALDGAEPYLPTGDGPVEAPPGAVVRLTGAHFATSPPYPTVWFDDVRASVVGVGAFGAYLDVVAPAGAVGDVFDVTVQNSDGQAVRRAAHFRVAAPPVLDVLRIDPPHAVLQEGAVQEFAVTLTEPAPPLGLSVTLAATGAVGAMPTTLAFPGGAAYAKFQLAASPTPTSGAISASLVSTVAADVVVSFPARVASIAPQSVHLVEHGKQTFVVTLDAPAPPVGLDVGVAATGGVGTVPPALHFAEGETSATFDLAATDVRAVGAVVVSSADSVAADVVVAPPDSIDLSGWTIVQQNSLRTFSVPAGTVLREGGYLVVGRKATREQFEAFWGRTLGDGVVYANSLDKFLVVNGSETFELRDAAGVSVDGPSAAMPSAGGADLRRIPGTPAGAATSWTASSATPASNATPGAGQSATTTPLGVYVAEFSDAVGSGNYVYEFVQIYFDRLP